MKEHGIHFSPRREDIPLRRSTTNGLTTKYLKDSLEKIDGSIFSLVSHALEEPLHWRVPRVESKWFTELYEKRGYSSTTLSELAKLDFDMVQAIHLEDLKHASRSDPVGIERWFTYCQGVTIVGFELGFVDLYFGCTVAEVVEKYNLGYQVNLCTRDLLVENFFCTVGFSYLPNFSHGRRTITKVAAMITTLDDVFDVFGTLGELEQFTDVINRFVFSLPLRRHLVTLTCARSFKGEMERGSILSFSAYSPATYVAGEKSVTCSPISCSELYMHETGATEPEARSHIKSLIDKTWKKLNKERANVNSESSREFIDYVTNLARMAQFMYGEGDEDFHLDVIKSHVLSLLFTPIHEI
ncbi:R-linalool synthase QH5, chloroplastic [Tanacetum coccineum]